MPDVNDMMNKRMNDVSQALTVLGESWRGDWSDFDGRTLRHQLDELSRALDNLHEPFDIEQWAAGLNICLKHRGWTDYCGTMGC